MKIDWQMVSAFAAIVYTVGTFMLWLSTRRALQVARDAFKLNFLVAFHEMEASVVDAIGGGARWVDAEETRRERALRLMQKVFPNEWELLAPRGNSKDTSRSS